MDNVKKLFSLIKGKRLIYLFAIISTCLSALFSLLLPQVIKYAVDTVINGQKSNLNFYNIGLFGCMILIFVISLAQGFFAFLRGKLSSSATEDIIMNLKNTLFKHIQDLPYSYHVKAMAGDLLQRATSDVETIRLFLGTQVMELGRIIFVVFFSLVFMFSINMKLSALSLIFIPVVLVFSFWFAKKVGQVFLNVDEKEGELSVVLNENVAGIRVVKAFGRAKFEIDKFEKKNSAHRDLACGLINQMAFFWSLSDLFCLIQIAIILFFGINMIYNNEITIGTFFLFNTYVGMLIWPIRSLGRILGDMSKMGVSLKRVDEILKEKAENYDDLLMPDLKGDIVFDDVHFSYDDNEEILNGMSFKVKKGETIGILGATGSGKSTVMQLLVRLYDIKSGKITINNFDINKINKKWLREKVGMVLQETFLFSKTIEENIKMANLSTDNSELINATKIASIHHDIMSFEKGYETLVGEKGVTLSGGQKQRISIARALIKNSDILIFDDSLSAVDTETDKQIRDALKARSHDTTTFIISQRITTLMETSRVFIIENGKIVANGTHDELINQECLYKRIWQIQNSEDF